ncbi:MAG: LysR family transcriptional regulator [Acetobacteraceae bacterium]
MRYLFDTGALQSFLAVAEELNFRRAAERLHIDQSALSRRIQKLEHQLGCALFSRSTREVRLTEAGHSFYDDNRDALARLAEAVRRARRVAEGKTGHLRIAYMSFAALDVMPRAIRAFRAAHPAISVEITYLRTQGQKLALVRNEIDAGFLIGPFVHQDFATLKVNEERLLVLLPTAHRLRTQERIQMRDVAACDLILGDLVQWDFYREIIAEMFLAKGLALGAALEASSTLGILGLVAAGLGVSVYPEGVRRFRPAGVAMMEIEDCERLIETTLVWRRDRSDRALARFVACCKNEFSKAARSQTVDEIVPIPL